MITSWKDEIKQTLEAGYCIVSNAFGGDDIVKMRAEILANLHLMSNTRRTRTAFHIAGFHRFFDLEHLHRQISRNERVQSALRAIYGPSTVVALGLTDITINRSQPWHTDLLRGRYAHFLDTENCWEPTAPPCLKVLVYLQDSQSLKVIPGSHLKPIDLSSDSNVVPQNAEQVRRIKLSAGDVILMDIRLIHRGATEEQMSEMTLGVDAKILISTVFGDRSTALSQSMQIGNMQRLIDWENRNLAV